jgi:hypothetical protein
MERSRAVISPPPRITFDRSEDLAELASAGSDKVRFVQVPERQYFAIDGTEPPGGPLYLAAVGTVYPVAYALHFALRRRGVKARVGMLEGLYWLTPEEILDGDEPGRRAEEDYHWRWQLLIAIPQDAGEVEIETAIHEASERRPLPALDRLHVVRWEEGTAAQLTHVGPYSAETPTIRRLHQAIVEAGFEPHGQHHEIYLNNPREVGEDKARTLVRRPVRPMGEASALD